SDIIVSLTGIDETFSQTVYARYAYPIRNIVWGARFADITGRTPEGEFVLDYAYFDDVITVENPPPEKQLAAE
ncbi:MAG: ATP-sensitive inward rectifier potassium channel 10, partial [Candidatus Binataceae bacterium]